MLRSRRSPRASALESSHQRFGRCCGTLLTGIAPTYLRTDVTGRLPDHGELAANPLWWPPTKIAGRYLGPYLAETARRGEGSPLDDQPMPSDDPREVQAGHREARELALTFALADANGGDYRWQSLDGSTSSSS